MKRIVILTLLIFSLNPVFSFSQVTKGINKNLENLSGQCAECVAYYRLVYQAMNSSGETATAKSYRELEDMVMLYALILAHPGRNKNKAIEVTNSRIEMYIKMMKKETNNRNENMSILINKYHFGCMELVKKPPEILINLMQKE